MSSTGSKSDFMATLSTMTVTTMQPMCLLVGTYLMVMFY